MVFFSIGVSRDGTRNNKKGIQINESLKNKLNLFLF